MIYTSNVSNSIIFKLNKSINKKKLLNLILYTQNVDIILVDPGNIIEYLNQRNKKKLCNLIKSKQNYFCYFFRNLIKYSLKVIYQLKKYSIYNLINNQSINTLGVHIRFGKYGDFHEKNATYFTNTKCLSHFSDIIKDKLKMGYIDYIILTSDSSFITNITYPNVIVVRNILKSKTIKHSNKWYFKSLNNDSIECLLEMYMLSRSNHLVLTKNSAFSKVAYYMNENCNVDNCVFI